MNKLLLTIKEKSELFALSSHIRRVFLDAFNQLVPSKRAAEVSNLTRGAAYRLQSKKKWEVVSFGYPHALRFDLSTESALKPLILFCDWRGLIKESPR